jgi:NAD-dependent deacetylase
MQEQVAQIADKIKAGGRNVVFTGAGISTESGIPDFRSKGGIWDKFRPVYFDEFMSSSDARREYWRRWTELYQGILAAQPNPAHQALAELNKMGLLQAVVTQNVDGLHQESGLPDDKVIELHGNTRRIRCLGCGEVFPVDDIRQRLTAGDEAPECGCGGFLKPDTISFGQAMPAAEVEKSIALSRGSDFFMVVGSTLLVQPAAHMPYYAKDNGAFLAIVNLSETPCDGICDVLIREKAGRTLQAILAAVAGK